MTSLPTGSALVARLLARGPGLHAVLFYGAQGSRALQNGLELAKGWLCPRSTENGPCNVCTVCSTFDSGRAVDCLRVAPTGPSRVIKTHSITGGDPKDPALPVVEFIRTAPLAARLKVVLIEDADRMNSTSANALLKTLEEPGPHLKLILTTSSVSALLPTILSRCITIACPLPASAELDAEFAPIDEYEAVFSEGSPGQLQRIRAGAAPYQKLWDLLESLDSQSIGAAVGAAERFRIASEGLPDKDFGGARGAHSEAIRLLAVWLAYRHADKPEVLSAAVEAHRRVVGNASVATQLDSLFCRILHH